MSSRLERRDHIAGNRVCKARHRGAILYLELAGFVTDETIHVDGGQSAGP